MPELPPTSVCPSNSDEPDRTGQYEGSATPFSGDAVEAGTIIAGKYKLLQAIGEGGMGAVWMAQQIEPVKRLVALKLIKAGMDSKTVIARFEAERQALSMMDHPNIARVFDVGTTANGRPFFVMELVKGTPITEFCDARKMTPKQRLELFVPVCNAIQHAHQKGIIHRDIKPSNVLVALHDDKPVPKVIDFGVAKAIGQPLTERTLHTAFEQVVGTPAYMSPEQATFNQLDIDTRSDVYSLGVLLYELLTGTTPIERERFRKVALMEMLRVVREEEPPRPSTRLSSTEARASISAVRGTEPAKLSQAFRGELDWIAMKALEKDRTRRYETANALARDVQRFLADEVVEARPPSMSYRMRKFVRRHKGRVVAASVILLALIGGFIGTAYGVIEAGNQRIANSLREQAERDRDAAEVARSESDQARGVAVAAREGETQAKIVAESARDDLAKEREKLARVEYGRTMQVAHQEWRDNNLVAARALLESTRADLRGWEWHYVHRLCHADLFTLKGHNAVVHSASFSTDGSRVVTGCREGTVKVWNAKTGAELLTFKGHKGDITSATFSADGSRVVTAGLDRTTVKSGFQDEPTVTETMVKVWDAKMGNQLLTLKGHTSYVHSASFSTDGSRIVTGSGDKTAKVWDAKTGAELLTINGHTNGVRSASFSVDGSRVLTGSDDHTAKVWDSKTGTELLTIKGHTSGVSSASFSADGSRIVTGSGEGTAKVWDAQTGAELLTLRGHTASVISASFNADGSRVVTGSFDKTARVWNAKSGEFLILKGHIGEIFSASFSADGSRVVTGSGDRTAKVWDANTGEVVITLRDPTGSLKPSVSADKSRVVEAGSNNTVKVWDAKTLANTRGILLTLRGHTGYVDSASFSPDGSRIVTGSRDQTAKVWDAKTGAELFTLKGHADMITSASFSADGSRIVTGGSWDNTAKVWDAKTGVELLTLRGHTDYVTSASFNADGSRIVTGSWDRTAKIWDAKTGAEIFTLKGQNVYVSFSTDGSRIVTGSSDKTATVWDAKTGFELFTLKGHTSGVQSASFSADMSRIVTGSRDQTAKVWDAKTGAELLTLRHTFPVDSASFSADGSKIVTGSSNYWTAVWDSRPVNREFLPRELAPPPRAVPDSGR